jgi:hypothetical protein
MWVHLAAENSAVNLDHVSRLFVEVTGSGAALKADLNGKTLMLGYFSSKEAALASLADLLAQRERNVPVAHVKAS